MGANVIPRAGKVKPPFQYHTPQMSVVAASTANVDEDFAPAIIDGVSLVTGERVLLKDQTDPIENGVYVFAGAGNPMARASDLNDDSEFKYGVKVYVREGTAHADQTWKLTSDEVTVGVDAISFSLIGEIAGSGTTNTVSKFTSANVVGDSSITDDGSTVATASLFDVTNTTDSTSATTGAITTAGGLGVGKDLWVGDDINADGNVLTLNEANNGVANTLNVDLRAYDSAGNVTDLIAIDNSSNKVVIGQFDASSAQDGVIINVGAGYQHAVFDQNRALFNSSASALGFRILKDTSGQALDYDDATDAFTIGSETTFQADVMIDEGSFLGIGNANPSGAIDIYGNTVNETRIQIRRAEDSNGMPTLEFQKGRGTIASPSAIQNADILSRLDSDGYDSTAWALGVRFECKATENWSASAHGCELRILVQEKGTTTNRNVVTFASETINSVTARTRLNVLNLPTSATGLNTGDLWNNSGVVNVA